jgi:prephenate dehydratase
MADNNETLLKYSDNLVELEGAIDKSNMSQFAKRTIELPTLESKPTIEELLNNIFPARVIEMDGRYFRNPVSHE